MRHLDDFEARLANVPLFRACSKQDLRHIARLADSDTCRAGDVLVREGRRGNELYVIVNGEAEVTRDGATLATLKPGDYFGELAVLRPAPRTATATALEPLDVAVLTSEEFVTLLEKNPGATLGILRSVIGRLRDSDKRRVEFGALDTVGRVGRLIVELAERTARRATRRSAFGSRSVRRSWRDGRAPRVRQW
jgi:CRP/FNR family transcriptional regulator, cyclic AMP receptor protein